jgi:2-methylcitrate dehydratase PrpD
VWSAVIACAVERAASLADSLAAAALGYELTVRLAEAAGADHRRGWHTTATAGTAGAAGAAARLLGDDEVDAVAHAVSVAGGSAHAIVERSGTRFLHRSHAASTGVACARAAAAGLRGSRGVLESGRGAFGRLEGDPLAPRASAAVEETGFRLYAANGFAHAAADAARSLGPVDPPEVERVRAVISPPGALALASNPAPADDEEAWWSIEHAVAVCLAAGDAGALAGGRGGDDVLALCGRVDLHAGDEGWGATIEVTRRDGGRAAASVDGPPGQDDRPATDGDLVAKWRRLTGSDGSPFFERLLGADAEEPLAPLLDEQLGALLR